MIRIGIVGCGRILAAHLRGYRLLREAGVDDFRITALCARREDDALGYVRRGSGPPQREPVGTAPGDPLAVGDEYLSDFQDDVEVEVFTDYRRMIAEGPVDAVNDFTTHALHHQVAQEAFAHGKHLLTQKPLAVSVAAGRRMCEAAEAKGLTLGVFENARNRPSTRYLRWLLDSDRLGRLQAILMLNFGNWWAPDGIVANTPWRHSLVEGGGITLDIGVHLLDVFRYHAGEVTAVTARTAVLEPERRTVDDAGHEVNRITCDAEDTLLATFETEPGVLGQMTASWAGHGGGLTAGGGRGIAYYASRGRVLGEDVHFDDAPATSLESVRTELDEAARARWFPLDLEEPFALNQLDWLEAIRGGREPETSGREGLADLAAAFAMLESSRAGRRVEVAEVLDGALRDYQRPIDERFGLG